MGRNLSVLCRSVGTTFVKEPIWGQIAFTQIYLWRGGLFLFLFANFSKDINQYTLGIITFSVVIHNYTVVIQFNRFLLYIGTSYVLVLVVWD